MAELSTQADARPTRRAGHRLGLRREILAAALLIVAVGVVGVVIAASRAFSPETAARDYFTALGNGDANAAWSDSIVDAAGNAPTATFLDRASLAAALRSGKPTYCEATAIQRAEGRDGPEEPPAVAVHGVIGVRTGPRSRSPAARPRQIALLHGPPARRRPSEPGPPLADETAPGRSWWVGLISPLVLQLLSWPYRRVGC